MPADHSAPTPSHVADMAATLGRELTSDQAHGLSRYLDLLATWNRRMNLVGPRDWRTILAELVADSWFLADFLVLLPLPEHPRTADLGAGAGLPGLPLRLFWPHGTYHLVEIRRKRTAFLLQAIAAMDLKRTIVRPERAEQALPSLAPLDLCLSRAFLPWPQVLELVKPWATPGGATIILANEPPPPCLPQGWSLIRSQAYVIAGRIRYFWGLAEASISR